MKYLPKISSGRKNQVKLSSPKSCFLVFCALPPAKNTDVSQKVLVLSKIRSFLLTYVNSCPLFVHFPFIIHSYYRHTYFIFQGEIAAKHQKNCTILFVQFFKIDLFLLNLILI